ncbi:MAG: preprotein translocase subunit SecG [Erysipelotrichaceae bacterium]|nr:preprotein translocase subunit SecG [Erysipelotrichaceae bacterium]
MENFLNVLLMIDSGLVIILVLLQSGKSDGLSAAFTGSGDLNLFAVQKERGPEKVISRMTLVCGVIFLALVIALQVI